MIWALWAGSLIAAGLFGFAVGAERQRRGDKALRAALETIGKEIRAIAKATPQPKETP
ncbi:MAG: hypothetical protein P4L76_18070 [Beijerinckiaceae bacterium]|nr:hypothetical protein [Beijerinckiaceae bacterium]